MPRTMQRSHIGPRELRRIDSMTAAQCRQFEQLGDIGINFDRNTLRQILSGSGFDSADTGAVPLQTGANQSVPVQFLQNFLPGMVRLLTSARKIDTLVGITTAGTWEDESVVQGVLESVGEAGIYTDFGNIPLSSYNQTFAVRDIVRGEKGMEVGRLEEARAARVPGMNTGAEKRAAAALALEIFRNKVGFRGYNEGNNRTYGFLNDPEMLPFFSLPQNGAGTSTKWKDKTFLEITADLRLMAAQLRVQGQENIDPSTAPITLALGTACHEYLTVTNVQGTLSVRGWIKENYSNWRIESCPELDNANGGLSGVYLYAETVEDGGTDDNRTIIQIVPAKLQALGVEKKSKSYLEDWTNATAGVMTKRPFAVVRATGA